MLFSADSVFAGGTVSYIAESGSVGDYIDSLTRLRYFGPQALYPGHGISTTPMEDIDQAIAKAQNILASKIDGAPEIFTRSPTTIGGLEARTISRLVYEPLRFEAHQLWIANIDLV